MQPTSPRKKQLVSKVITVPGNLHLGCDEFNAGLFYESHERFEEIWQYERGPVRDFYKGLIRDRVKLANVDDIVASPTANQRWAAVGEKL